MTRYIERAGGTNPAGRVRREESNCEVALVIGELEAVLLLVRDVLVSRAEEVLPVT